MKRKNLSVPVSLMGISLILLVVLQGLWLRTEFRSARDAFSRETNMAFRSTLYQLSDSLFFNNLTQWDDSLSDADAEKVRGLSIRPESIKHMSIVDLGPDENAQNQKPGEEKTTRQITLSLRDPDNPADSIRVSRQVTTSPREMFWMFTSSQEGFDVEAIALHFRRNLEPDYSKIDFEIREREVDQNQERGHIRRNRSDSLPYTTSWYPLARRLYAAEFTNGKQYLYRKLTPQAGFAGITTLLILVSFLMVYRNLRSQQKLMEQKDSFISNVTHELKTPVASVGVALEAMKNFDVLDDRQKTMEYLEQAENELKRLGMMTDKILKTSVQDYGDEIIRHRAPVKLNKLVEKVQSSFGIMAEQMNIAFVIDNSSDAVISGNEEHLAQMIYNLVDNAFKYAATGRFIKIIIGELPGWVVLEVRDKGPGIAAEHKSKIFDRFYRIPTGNVHDVKGYGLGLHYVAGVVKHHNGNIHLESTPGKGCRFIVRLPR